MMDDLLVGWESRLRELTGEMGHLFAQPEPREVFHDLVEGLLSDLEKKNGWTAGAAGRAHSSGPDPGFLSAAGRPDGACGRARWAAVLAHHRSDAAGALQWTDGEMERRVARP